MHSNKVVIENENLSLAAMLLNVEPFPKVLKNDICLLRIAFVAKVRFMPLNQACMYEDSMNYTLLQNE
jgi:hypothetical protein